jgi:hypothetical protein
MTLTACLGDDNDSQGLSRQEISECLQAVKGNYTGKIVFENHNPNNYNDIADTLDIAWSITADTLIIVNEFPQVVVLDRITEEPMKEALEAAAPAPLKSIFGFYQTDPIGFLLYPYSVVYDIELNGAPHKATLAFYINNYSFALFDAPSRVMQMRFQVAGLYLDENANHNYLTNASYNNSSIPVIITNADLK